MNLKKTSISDIKAPVKEEMDQFETYFKDSMKTKVRLLNVINRYIIKRKGKEIRPILVFLSAKLAGTINDSTYTAAALTQLLHTATLIHDDVVDEAYERRGFFSVNALWKTKAAVLVGDFLLSKGLLIALDNNEFGQLKVVSDAVREMSEGELLQLEKSRKLNITEEVYFDIIYKKTASLIASCTELGAISAGASEEDQQKLKQFGSHLGIAFQMKDDLFDYEKQGTIGKPTGNDIKEKKLTLPLIYALRNISDKDRRWALKIIRKHNKNKVKVNELISFVKDNGGIDYTSQKMIEYKQKAMNILHEFPTSEAREALINLVDYTISRNK
ncbi:polyprenyl synthetase family protein [Labilibaculum sp. DW002]|uniref:Polyprenyl synthetase family protein n=1 Tax=Paralabilibaculum antarcticum TaxID=2912572 RepID=A0ABT5VWT0_9BACT|nr:polyprenyl synthetase family protein [Labilibaculum sp. DW002]MDE5419874.1 polyprenyl synthetase family protein [Labilibaculum sp. DW002]